MKSYLARDADVSRPVMAALLLAGTLVACPEAFAQQRPASLLVWDFDDSLTNFFGGAYNVFQREPSWARTYLDPDVRRSTSGHSLRIIAHRDADGFCGVWMDLCLPGRSPRRFFDATPYRFLTFWVKGAKGATDIDIEISDAVSSEREGSSPKRPLSAYLPKGFTGEWQEVFIPLSDFWGLDLRSLVRMNLNFTSPDNYTIYLDQIGFKAAKTAAFTPRKIADARNPGNTPRSDGRAMWAWNTRALLGDAAEMDHFLQFCAGERIRRIYLSLELARGANSNSPHYEVLSPDRYREFISRAHEQHLEIEGLAGAPEWAAQENHPYAVAAVDAVAAFNKASLAGSRFDGVHFDVEPYSLVGYADPEYRSQLLRDFLQMNSLCAERAKNANMSFSCDVPAWFYPTANPERRELSVEFNGQEKTVGEHLTDLLDSVTIMDYTNHADGANGIIARAIPPLDYAAPKGKSIVVGLETFLESESTVYFLCGLPSEEFRRRLRASELRNQLFLGDFRLSTFSDETNIHIGLSAPKNLEGARRVEFEKSLARLAREFGAASDPEKYPVQPILDAAGAALAQEREWKDFETFEITDSETQRKIAGFRANHLMLPSITFNGLRREVFNEEVRSVVEWLGRYRGFGGVAIHFYDSFRGLAEK